MAMPLYMNISHNELTEVLVGSTNLESLLSLGQGKMVCLDIKPPLYSSSSQ